MDKVFNERFEPKKSWYFLSIRNMLQKRTLPYILQWLNEDRLNNGGVIGITLTATVSNEIMNPPFISFSVDLLAGGKGFHFTKQLTLSSNVVCITTKWLITQFISFNRVHVE